MRSPREGIMKSKIRISVISALLFVTIVHPMNDASAASSTCKKDKVTTVNTSLQTLYAGDSLTVTFRGVGGGCGTGNFKVIVSSSPETNSQGYLNGQISNVALNVNPTGADSNYQRVTHIRQFSSSNIGEFLQYYFVTTSGVKVRSVVVAVSESGL